MTVTHSRLVTTALTVALGAAASGCSTNSSVNSAGVSRTIQSSRRMADGKQWLTENLWINTDAGSYCYGDSELNCERYGRLYTWDSAQQGCRLIGADWRLPTDDEWRSLAKHYGGLREESDDSGRASYEALMRGGNSGFNAILGGDRESDGGRYERLDAHGFYWTVSETAAVSAWFYNFGLGQTSLNHHREGNKRMAMSVRCVRN
jgi:uncharacterized protein (TIGR02145 family)